jgi:hypothetical protein
MTFDMQLAELYQRRNLVDELIRKLERYADLIHYHKTSSRSSGIRLKQLAS